jgi:predicted permease
MDALIHDIRYALRTMARSPGFTAIAVLTIALGVGANTAVFSIVNALLMRTLPVEKPEELAIIGDPKSVNQQSGGSPRVDVISYPLYLELLQTNEAFSSIAAAGRPTNARVTLGEPGEDKNGESVNLRIVTGNYFSTLGTNAVLGRTFTQQDDSSQGSAPYVVISNGYWHRRFGGERAVLNRTIRVNGYPVTIIGVTPAGFFGDVVGEKPDLWLPMMMQSSIMPGRNWLDDATISWLMLIGRRKPDVSLDAAAASVNVGLQRVAHSGFVSQFEADDQRQFQKLKVLVTDGSKGLSNLRNRFRKPLFLLMAIVALVLLIACINVANLLLARSSARGTEIAVRMAIGASFPRLLRQLLTESVMLALLGGGVGVLVALWGADALVRIVTRAQVTVPLDVNPDFRVLAFTLLVSILTGILFGLVPALRLRSVDLTPELKASGRTTSAGGSRPALSNALIVGQLAISMIVLFTALLLVRSLRHLQEVDTGYPREHMAMVNVDMISSGYLDERLSVGMQGLLERLRSLPGVEGATYSMNGLFSGTEGSTSVLIDGVANPRDEEDPPNFDSVGPGYFAAVGIPLASGRDIAESDTATSHRVAVINETMAKFYFPNQNPIGHRITVDDDDNRQKPYEIVGVARDARDKDVRDAITRRFYVAHSQTFAPSRLNPKFLLRASGDPAQLTNSIKSAVAAFDPTIVMQTDTVTERVRDLLGNEMVIAKLTTMFAVLAVALACIGLYGVISYAVAGRTREIGVRIALGASPGDVLWLVLRKAVLLVAIGVAIGIPLSTAATTGLRGMIFGVRPVDPLSIGVATLLLAMVGPLAAFLPARRATKVDPVDALRNE